MEGKERTGLVGGVRFGEYIILLHASALTRQE